MYIGGAIGDVEMVAVCVYVSVGTSIMVENSTKLFQTLKVRCSR